MQITENIAWKKHGARHAQVDCHCAVPSVTPAAISAPTLTLAALMRQPTSKSCSKCPRPTISTVLQTSRTGRRLPRHSPSWKTIQGWLDRRQTCQYSEPRP